MRTFSPPPPQPQVDPKEVFTGSIWQRWLASVYSRLAACLVKDNQAAVASVSGVATAVATLPASGVGVFLVTCNAGMLADAANYGAWAMIAKDGSTSRLMTVGNAPLQTITVSGLSVLSTQSSGSAKALSCTVVQIG
jgi:hypothetical protein